MSIKVPNWKKFEVESMALELLTKYAVWKKEQLTPPINIDEIVERYFMLSLEFCDLKNHLAIPDVLGATWFDDEIIRIDSSLEEKEGRLSFTIAHEVGHWYMHRPIYEMGKVSIPLFSYDDAPPSAAIVCRAAGRKEPAEKQADQFAATLLAPPKLLRDLVIEISGANQFTVDNLESSCDEPAKNPCLRKAAKMLIEAGFSNVSVEAMCYRLIDLNLVVDSSPSQTALF